MKKGMQTTVDARRAAVAEGLIARKTYRVMAEEHGVSFGTIAGDVEALRKEWSKTYGKAEQVFDRSLMDLEHLHATAVDVMQTTSGADRLASIDRVLKISDQRNRLLNLYPRPGGETDAIPTGPIELRIEVIQPGNRNLLPQEEDGPGYDIDAEGLNHVE